MAPTATAAGQFYGSQIQTMGITNLAPHIQKAVSIIISKVMFSKTCFTELLTGFHVYDSTCRRDIWKALARVTNIRNEFKSTTQMIHKNISSELNGDHDIMNGKRSKI